ncbi:MAG: DUF748 domain-containing protein [Planctomycetes bacterium]|nr:DUF748 domain-containing protein [Planctomycetota bacterium]
MTEPTPTPAVQPQTPPAPPKRRRWKRILLWTSAITAGLILLVLLLGPLVISSVARGQVVAAVNDNIHGTAVVDDFSFSWPATVHMKGFAVTDREGKPVFSAQSVALDVSLWKALGGTYVVDARIEGPAVVVRRDETGRTNIETLLKERPTQEPKPPRERGQEELPRVRAHLLISNGRVEFVDPTTGRTLLDEVNVEAHVDSLDQPIRFEATAGGRQIVAGGELTVGPETLQGPVRYELTGVNLATFLPIAAAYAPIEKLEGILTGRGEYRFTSAKSLSGQGTLAITDLLAAGPAIGPNPARSKRLLLTNEIHLDRDGAGTQKLTFSADDYLSLDVRAQTENLFADDRIVDAKLDLTSNLKGLTEAAGPLLKIKSGYTVAGDAHISSEIHAARRRSTLALDARLENLSASDEQGRPVPIDPSITFALDGRYEASGVVEIAKAQLRSGNAALDARGGIDLNQRAIRDSSMQANVDLDALARQLSSFMDLGVGFGGQVRVDAKLAASGERGEGSADVAVRGLRLTRVAGKSLGPIDATLAAAGVLDMSAGGRTKLERLDLHSDLLDVHMEGEVADLLNADRTDGGFSYRATARPTRIQEKLGAPLQGEDISATGRLTLHQRQATLQGEIKAPSLQAHSAHVRELALTWDALLDTGTGRFDAREATLSTASLNIAQVAVKDVLLKISAAQQGELIEISRIELASDLVRGTGSATMRQTSKTAQGRLDLKGDVAPVLEVVRAFAPDVRAVKADGSWEASLSAGAVTSDSGRMDIASLTLVAPGLDLQMSGQIAGFLSEPRRLDGTLALKAKAQPDKLPPLFDISLAGETVTTDAEATLRGDALSAKGRISTPRLEITMPEGRSKFAQRDLAGTFELAMDRAITGDLNFTTQTQVTGADDYDLRGLAKVELRLAGDTSLFKATGQAIIERFELAAAGTKIAEPKVELALDADVGMEKLDCVIHRAQLGSSFLRGTLKGNILNAKTEPVLRGLTGDFAYVPDKLGAVLQPWLPGKLSGAKEQKLTFTLDGSAKELDALAILRGSEGKASFDLAQFTTKAFSVQGELQTRVADERVTTESSLDLNNGKAALTSVLDLREAKDARSTAKAELRTVDTNAQMSSLLTLIHPMFAVAQGSVDALIDGKVDCVLDLAYHAPLTKEALTGGWDALPKKPINGRGHFEIRGLALRGSPLLGEVLKAIDEEAAGDLQLDPIDFTIVDGRVRYDRPVPMRISKIQTTWTGTIGLDQTLDLAWKIPVTDRLLNRFPFLKRWKDQLITIPVRGTPTRPRVQIDEVIADLAKQAAAKAIEEKGEDVLEDILGGRDEKEARKLLEDADRLYAEGKRGEASPLYLRIYERYHKTRVYKENKDRIKQRMGGQ